MERKTGKQVDLRAATPLARADDLVVEELGDERLIYDLRVHRAHSLSTTAAAVWQRCDGKTGVAGLAVELGLEPDTVQRALDELEACELLEAPPRSGTTRRELGIKLVGAAAAAPLIVSLTAPPALAVLTPTIEFCTNGGLSHGCGKDCDDRHCCCCCQQIPNPPLLCQGDSKCCLPASQCGPIFKGNCSNVSPCP